MFCPGCGLEEIHSNQFCRACGANLKTVRTALEKPDQITNSATFARSEIGRVIASKINEMQSAKGNNYAKELAILTENVLPQVTKFIESPEEKKLRQLREGVVTASTGIGLVPLGIILNLFIGMPGLVVVGAGLLISFIGLGIIINGMWLTVPRKSLEDKSNEAERQRELDKNNSSETNELFLSKENAPPFVSVVEHTTRQLSKNRADFGYMRYKD
jgi:hypothetical protein